MVVRITPNDRQNPPGKLADAELHFTEGPLEGLRLVGFAVEIASPPEAVTVGRFDIAEKKHLGLRNDGVLRMAERHKLIVTYRSDKLGLQLDGKSLRVPNEGIWLVGDKGEIIFTADQGFTEPPTPVGFQFADVRGNLSDIGVVLIDPGVQDAAAQERLMTGLRQALRALD